MKNKFKLLGLLFLAVSASMLSCTKESGINGGNSNDVGGQNNGGSQVGGYCTIAPETKQIDGGSGSFSISVSSNTNWSVSLNNSGSQSITGLSISTYLGNGNGNITVHYDAVTTQYYQQRGVVIVTYDGYGGVRQTKTCSVYRKHLP